MPPDSSGRLADAARRRHELTRAKTIRSLRELDRTGTPVTFETVARHAEVSRSWLYTQPDLRAEIERLRAATRQAREPAIPAAQRTSTDSLLRRLEAATQHNRRLTEENQRLRHQLAHALGDQRAARDRAEPPSDPNSRNRASVTISPR
jgi:hypothetical protein